MTDESFPAHELGDEHEGVVIPKANAWLSQIDEAGITG
jgi:hypothetical protein